jgi:hypothetical protein
MAPSWLKVLRTALALWAPFNLFNNISLLSEAVTANSRHYSTGHQPEKTALNQHQWIRVSIPVALFALSIDTAQSYPKTIILSLELVTELAAAYIDSALDKLLLLKLTGRSDTIYYNCESLDISRNRLCRHRTD